MTYFCFGAVLKHEMIIYYLTHFLQLLNNLLKILRQRCEDHDRPAIPGMLEAQSTCVEALAVLAQLRFFSSVDRISQNGVADVSHVDTDLVGSACFQTAADVGIAPIASHHLPVGHRMLGIAL